MRVFALECVAAMLLASGTRIEFRFNRDVALFARRFRSRSWRLYRLNEFPLAFWSSASLSTFKVFSSRNDLPRIMLES